MITASVTVVSEPIGAAPSRRRHPSPNRPSRRVGRRHPAPPTVSRRGALALVGPWLHCCAVLHRRDRRSADSLAARAALPGDAAAQWPQLFPGQPNRCGRRIAPAETASRLAVDPLHGPAGSCCWTGATLARIPAHRPSCPSPASRLSSNHRNLERSPAPGSLAALAATPTRTEPRCRSLERFGAFNPAVLQANQVGNPDSLLALGSTASICPPIHGIPARIIVPALAGVHNTNMGCAVHRIRQR